MNNNILSKCVDLLPGEVVLFKKEDCEVQVIDLKPYGGQHVGTGPYGIKVIHKPTGMYAYCDCQRSQHKNREIAMQMLEYGVACLD